MLSKPRTQPRKHPLHQQWDSFQSSFNTVQTLPRRRRLEAARAVMPQGHNGTADAPESLGCKTKKKRRPGAPEGRWTCGDCCRQGSAAHHCTKEQPQILLPCPRYENWLAELIFWLNNVAIHTETKASSSTWRYSHHWAGRPEGSQNCFDGICISAVTRPHRSLLLGSGERLPQQAGRIVCGA